jgi:hypothetical protein
LKDDEGETESTLHDTVLCCSAAEALHGRDPASAHINEKRRREGEPKVGGKFKIATERPQTRAQSPARPPVRADGSSSDPRHWWNAR